MKTQTPLLVAGFVWLFLSAGCTREKYRVVEKTDTNGYRYEEVTGDPLHARIYTLDNGLKVYLSRNTTEPSIQARIAVHAGSTYDPPATTGLAHYFEHLMFKGTDKIGTLDWEKEKPLLEEISGLFEQHRMEQDPQKKRAIYHRIDSVSQLAARYAIPNEYDKLITSIGGKNTIAGTSYDYTVYSSDIPSNELTKWAELESERFKHKVFRLFHTELETVYEEFNMYQDNDNYRQETVLAAALFPEHPYGRDVIGLPEHIKNPSVKNIYEFADKYYVPNNMAVILAGDLDYEEAIRIVDRYFGDMQKKELTLPVLHKEKPLAGPVVGTVTGPSPASVMLGFRLGGYNSDDDKYVTLIDMILSNTRAGLIDLDLKQKQKVLEAGCSPFELRDYTIHLFWGVPRQGQTLEEVRDLLLGELEKVKEGAFDEWLIQAVINNLRRNEMKQLEDNTSRAFDMMSSFTMDLPWVEKVRFFDDLEKITKPELVAFAREHYGDNYVIVYKHTGSNDTLVKVEKPEITPVSINRERQSAFYRKFTAEKVPPLQPVFVDFAEAIRHDSLPGGIRLDYVPNEVNELFTLEYLFDMGSDNDLKTPLAIRYLPYLGTDRYSAEEFQKELYRLGVDLSVYTSQRRTYIRLSGLQESMEEGIRLTEHLLGHVVPDTSAYHKFVKDILKERQDRKMQPHSILWGGMTNYAKYGKRSPYTHILSEEELHSIDPAELTSLIRELTGYKHYIFFYGTAGREKVRKLLAKYHHVPGTLRDYPPRILFPTQPNRNNVYFVNFDMVQANVILFSRDVPCDISLMPAGTLFNEYFGSGPSSIVFQEVRESKGLAYSAFARYAVAWVPDDDNILYGFVGTQANKMPQALQTMLTLLKKMPRAGKQFSLAHLSVIDRMSTERIHGTDIYFTWLENLDRGSDHDLRKDVYEGVQKMTMDDLERFFNDHVAKENYTFLILGNRENLDTMMMKKLGNFKELSLEEIFGY